MLHLVQSRPGLAKCKATAQDGDDVVFIGDGVICAESIDRCRVFIQVDDAERCGIRGDNKGELCSMADVVELVVQHHQSVSWR